MPLLGSPTVIVLLAVTNAIVGIALAWIAAAPRTAFVAVGSSSCSSSASLVALRPGGDRPAR